MSMAEPVYYFTRPDSFNKWTIGLYLLLTFAIFYLLGPSPRIVFWYGIMTQFSLYAFGYRALRNLSVYFIWLGIGLFHFHQYTVLNAAGFGMEWEYGAT